MKLATNFLPLQSFWKGFLLWFCHDIFNFPLGQNCKFLKKTAHHKFPWSNLSLNGLTEHQQVGHPVFLQAPGQQHAAIDSPDTWTFFLYLNKTNTTLLLMFTKNGLTVIFHHNRSDNIVTFPPHIWTHFKCYISNTVPTLRILRNNNKTPKSSIKGRYGGLISNR